MAIFLLLLIKFIALLIKNFYKNISCIAIYYVVSKFIILNIQLLYENKSIFKVITIRLCNVLFLTLQAILHTRKRIQSTSDDLLRQLDSRINSVPSITDTPTQPNQEKPRSRLSKLHKRYTSYGTIGRKSSSKLPPPASPSTFVAKDDASTRFSFEGSSSNFSPGFRFVLELV